VVFDLADPFAVERYREDFLELLRDDVDVVFANRREAEILLGRDEGHGEGRGEPESSGGDTTAATAATGDDNHKLAARLAQMVPLVALKTGKDGSLVAHPAIETVPARPITPRDTTGAGDMYAAGFLAGLVRGDSPRRCGEIAGILAEEIIQQVGAQFEVGRIRALAEELW